MRGYIFDTRLMHMIGVPQELWFTEELLSNHMVINLVSHGTIKKPVGIDSRSGWYIAMVYFTLYFMQLRLFSVNAEDVPWE